MLLPWYITCLLLFLLRIISVCMNLPAAPAVVQEYFRKYHYSTAFPSPPLGGLSRTPDNLCWFIFSTMFLYNTVSHSANLASKGLSVAISIVQE